MPFTHSKRIKIDQFLRVFQSRSIYTRVIGFGELLPSISDFRRQTSACSRQLPTKRVARSFQRGYGWGDLVPNEPALSRFGCVSAAINTGPWRQMVGRSGGCAECATAYRTCVVLIITLSGVGSHAALHGTHVTRFWHETPRGVVVVRRPPISPAVLVPRWTSPEIHKRPVCEDPLSLGFFFHASGEWVTANEPV